MRGRRWVRRAQAGLVGVVLMVTLTACSRAQVEDDLRFGWPRGVTKQGDKMRVTGKNRDDLQSAIALLRAAKVEMPLQFNNFRD